MSSPVKSVLPSVNSLTRSVQRARKKNDMIVVNPNSIGELMIPDVYKFTEDGKSFLLYDSGISKDRFLIYSTKENLELLADCDVWCCDGTFNSVPLIFEQFYTVHGIYRRKLLPLVYILARDK